MHSPILLQYLSVWGATTIRFINFFIQKRGDQSLFFNQCILYGFYSFRRGHFLFHFKASWRSRDGIRGFSSDAKCIHCTSSAFSFHALKNIGIDQVFNIPSCSNGSGLILFNVIFSWNNGFFSFWEFIQKGVQCFWFSFIKIDELGRFPEDSPVNDESDIFQGPF